MASRSGIGAATEIGQRVFLRKPTERDGKEHLALVRASRALYRGKASPPATPRTYAAYLARCDRPDFDGSFICARDGGAIIGAANLSQIFYGNFKSAFLGYYVGRAFAERGLMKEGLELVLKRAFVTLRLHRLEANIQPHNGRSLALVCRLGFQREGYSKRYLKIGGRWRDHERWALTVENWRARHRDRDRRARGADALVLASGRSRCKNARRP